jgi:hypothetical protein
VPIAWKRLCRDGRERGVGLRNERRDRGLDVRWRDGIKPRQALVCQLEQGVRCGRRGGRRLLGIVHGLEARCFLNASDTGFGAFDLAACSEALVT